MSSELISPSGMNRAVVSLGSNIDKEVNLFAAVKLLANMTTLVAVSSIYETAPIGLKNQANYWNAAVLIETSHGPGELVSQVLTKVETQLERVRQEDKNAPRTIDADLSLYNHEVLELDPDHFIPSPELVRFAHTIMPIVELLPDERHPVTGQTLREIADCILEEGILNGLVPPKKIRTISLEQLLGDN